MGVQGQIARCLSFRRWWFVLFTGLPGICFSPLLYAGGQQAGTAAATGDEKGELITQETQPSFRLQVERNLVLVRAVVRDAKGRAVGNLRKEDFRVYDSGKLQTITQFAVETPTTRPQGDLHPDQPEVDVEALPETAVPASTPRRYMALYFDDVHSSFEHLVYTRDAADRYLEASLQPGDRVGLFTSSGRDALDFTDDRQSLHQALFRLRPWPIVPRREETCPEISDYQAYLIVHARDIYALGIAEEEARQCDTTVIQGMPSDFTARARQHRNWAEVEAMRVLNLAETEATYALRGLEQLVRRMAVLPGERSIILISPGFFSETQRGQIGEVINRALRSNVIVNSIDARGLYVPLAGTDVSKPRMLPFRRTDLAGRKHLIELHGETRAADILDMLARDTGGQFFHNSNDYDLGFRKTGALPEVSYILAFSPQNLKFDGRFHSLKVRLASPERGLTVQARQGYYAPQKPADAAIQAKEEIEQAIFSQHEVKELPVEVHTQFFKFNETDARLSVVTRLDTRFLRFRKEADRNLNNLTVVTALFDRDGKYVTGKEKIIAFRLRDVSLERLLQTGLTMKTSFDVKPGTYLVRQVVRDVEGGQLSGLNRTVEIPY